MSYVTPDGTWSTDPKPLFATNTGSARNWVFYFLAFSVPVPGISKRDGVWYFAPDATHTAEIEFSKASGRYTRLRQLAEEWRKEKIKNMSKKRSWVVSATPSEEIL